MSGLGGGAEEGCGGALDGDGMSTRRCSRLSSRSDALPGSEALRSSLLWGVLTMEGLATEWRLVAVWCRLELERSRIATHGKLSTSCACERGVEALKMNAFVFRGCYMIR